MGRRQLFKLNLEKVDVAEDVDYDKLVEETEVRSSTRANACLKLTTVIWSRATAAMTYADFARQQR